MSKNVLENTLEKYLNFSFAKVWEPCINVHHAMGEQKISWASNFASLLASLGMLWKNLEVKP